VDAYAFLCSQTFAKTAIGFHGNTCSGGACLAAWDEIVGCAMKGTAGYTYKNGLRVASDCFRIGEKTRPMAAECLRLGSTFWNDIETEVSLGFAQFLPRRETRDDISLLLFELLDLIDFFVLYQLEDVMYEDY